MAIHIKSFLIGSSVSMFGFLLIHEQLSYRKRLTRKWPLREWFELQVHEIFRNKKQIGFESKSSIKPFAKNWNDTLESIQNLVADDEGRKEP
mmetsp:Transcript_25988/g.38403  ORF Transcript_25988/g.38403 Transcript_25988/m.38403 type:complete len:92 (-) Transcript_25988:193-468(-)